MDTDAGAFLLVLAGTPNLRTHLGRMSSTFWNRCERIGVGRLSESATREALETPLAPYRVTFTADALAQVVAESQCYPYFIQCWGEALCEAWLEAGRSQNCTIETGLIESAWPRFESIRTDYYLDRHQKLKQQGLLPMAAAVARVFDGHDVTLDENRLESEVASLTEHSEQAVATAIGQLSVLGYLRQPPGQERMAPGIPSLMRYVLSRERKTPDNSLAPSPV